MDEQEIVCRARTGDHDAFASLVEKHRAFLLSLVTCYVGSRDSPDAAQEIWLAVYRKLWQLEDGARFLPWLRKLAFYQCINYRKVRGRTRKREVYLSAGDWYRLVDYIADDDGRLEEILERKELRRHVARHLDQLPGEYGLILRLRYMRDLSLSEIAALAGLTLSTVKWRLHEGRRLLKARLASDIIGKGRRIP